MAFQPPMRPKTKPTVTSKEWYEEFLEKDEILLYITAALGVFLPGIVFFIYQKVHRMYSDYAAKKEAERIADEAARSEVAIIVLGEKGGVADSYRIRLEKVFEQEIAVPPKIWFASNLKASELSAYKGLAVFLVDTVEGGVASNCSLWLLDWMEDCAADQKQKKKSHFGDIRFAVAGYGSSRQGDAKYNKAATTLTKRLKILGSKQMISPELFDTEEQDDRNLEHFSLWCETLLDALDRNLPGRESGSEEESTDDESDGEEQEDLREKKTL